jgi:uncharacterized protein YgbK (DUF1537 family)
MKYLAIFISGLYLVCLSSCTVYTEKQSEAVSQSVYATKDSIDNARIDLAEEYINQAVKLIKPPKNRIDIQPIYTDMGSLTLVKKHRYGHILTTTNNPTQN